MRANNASNNKVKIIAISILSNCTRSWNCIILTRSVITSKLEISNHSFRHAAQTLWNKLPTSRRRFSVVYPSNDTKPSFNPPLSRHISVHQIVLFSSSSRLNQLKNPFYHSTCNLHLNFSSVVSCRAPRKYLTSSLLATAFEITVIYQFPMELYSQKGELQALEWKWFTRFLSSDNNL